MNAIDRATIFVLAAIMGVFALASTARAELLPYRVNAYHPWYVDMDTAVWDHIDTTEADFSFRYRTTDNPVMPWAIDPNGDRVMYAYRNAGLYYTRDDRPGRASIRSCGAPVPSCAWRYNRVDRTPDIPQPCEKPVAIAGTKRAYVSRQSLACFPAVSVLRYYNKNRKAPRGWRCSRSTTAAGCRSGARVARGLWLDADDLAQYNEAIKAPVEECGRVHITGITLNPRVWGVAPGSCAALNTDAVIMHVGRAFIMQNVALHMQGGFVCRGTWNGEYWCHDSQGHCLLFEVIHDGLIDAFHYPGGRFYYRTRTNITC